MELYILHQLREKKPSKRTLSTTGKTGLLRGNYYTLEKFPGSLFYLISLRNECSCFIPMWKLGHLIFFSFYISYAWFCQCSWLMMCETPLLWFADKVTTVARCLPKKGVEIYFIWWVRQDSSQRKRFKALQEAERVRWRMLPGLYTSLGSTPGLWKSTYSLLLNGQGVNSALSAGVVTARAWVLG